MHPYFRQCSFKQRHAPAGMPNHVRSRFGQSLLPSRQRKYVFPRAVKPHTSEPHTAQTERSAFAAARRAAEPAQIQKIQLGARYTSPGESPSHPRLRCGSPSPADRHRSAGSPSSAEFIPGCKSSDLKRHAPPSEYNPNPCDSDSESKPPPLRNTFRRSGKRKVPDKCRHDSVPY